MDKMKNNTEEKREYPRVNKLYLISYIPKERGRQTSPVSMGRTLDISPSGVRIEVFQQVNVESEMELEIAMEDTQSYINGKVIRSLESGKNVYILGIHFDDVCDDLVKKL